MTIGNLSEGYTTLREISSLRKLRPGDAAESQQFYFRVKEAHDWIQEKEPILKVWDFANDEDSVQIYLKKVNDLISDLDTFEQKLNELRITSQCMTERGHFDSNNIQESMHQLSNYFEGFRSEMAAQKQRLLDQKAVIEFIHEADEVNEWINTQMAVAASEDYGKDVSHVEMLIKTDQEKEAEISTDKLGQDFETIQSLLERQQGFQRDLAAIQQQVIGKLPT